MLHTTPTVTIAGQPLPSWIEQSALTRSMAGYCETSTHGLTCKYPAILSHMGRLLVVLPRFYSVLEMNDERLRSAQQATIQTLLTALREHREYRRRSASATEVELGMTTIGNPEGLLGVLEAALVLWRDFQEHGPLLLPTKRTSPHVRGRIHWPRTFRESLQLQSGPNPIFINPIRTRLRLDGAHPLTRLHLQTCDDAARLLGWLPPSARGPRADRVHALDILEGTRRTLAQDRHVRLWDEMYKFYSAQGRASGETRTSLSGCVANSFPHIWERMLSTALAPELTMPLPRGWYEDMRGTEISDGLKLEPDLLLEDDGKYFVLDAKDYALGSWPRTESIGKQILYRLFLSSEYQRGNLPLDRIFNAFLMPRALDETSLVASIGRHRLPHDPRDLGGIVIVAMDFTTVAISYARGRPDSKLRRALLDAVVAVAP